MNEKQQKAGYVFIGALIGAALMLIAQPFFNPKQDRKGEKITKAAKDYLNHLKQNEFAKAYDFLSKKSQEAYPKDSFVQDHEEAKWDPRESRVDEALISATDPKKAVVKAMIPHSLYHQNPLYLNVVEENKNWKFIVSPAMVAQKALPIRKGIGPQQPVPAGETPEVIAEAPPEGAGETPPASTPPEENGELKRNPNDPCGNGRVDEGEECDPKLASSCTQGVCRQDCSGCDEVSCGNGVCETDKNENINTCPSDCQPVCGNNVVETGEECDGNACNPGKCLDDCTCDSSTCGNAECESQFNENCNNCVFDCGECPR